MSAASTFAEGGCLCGAIRFRLKGDPVRVAHCHCRMCQKAAGAPLATWVEMPQAAVSFIRDKPRFYRSSELAERGFCPRCGSALVFRFIDGETIDIASATLDEPDRFAPQDNLWTASRLAYMKGFDSALPDYETERTA